MAQAAAQRGIAVERAEVAEQLSGGGEQHGVAGDQRLVGDVLCQGGLADAVGADQDDVGGLLEEVERHQRLDRGTIAAFGPAPVEVAERLEATDPRLLQPPLQAAAVAFLFLPAQQRHDPVGGGDLRPMREQSVQMQRGGAGAQGIGVTHRPRP